MQATEASATFLIVSIEKQSCSRPGNESYQKSWSQRRQKHDSVWGSGPLSISLGERPCPHSNPSATLERFSIMTWEFKLQSRCDAGGRGRAVISSVHPLNCQAFSPTLSAREEYELSSCPPWRRQPQTSSIEQHAVLLSHCSQQERPQRVDVEVTLVTMMTTANHTRR